MRVEIRSTGFAAPLEIGIALTVVLLMRKIKASIIKYSKRNGMAHIFCSRIYPLYFLPEVI